MGSNGVLLPEPGVKGTGFCGDRLRRGWIVGFCRSQFEISRIWAEAGMLQRVEAKTKKERKKSGSPVKIRREIHSLAKSRKQG